MPPRIIPILDRLRQDVAAGLAQPTIAEACREVNHRWRKGDLAGVGARRRRARGPGVLLLCPSGAVAAPGAARGLSRPSEADRRLHASPPGGTAGVEGPAGPAAVAVGAGAGRLGPGRRVVQAAG